MDDQLFIIKIIALADAKDMTEDQKAAAMLLALHRRDDVKRKRIEREARLDELELMDAVSFYSNKDKHDYYVGRVKGLTETCAECKHLKADHDERYCHKTYVTYDNKEMPCPCSCPKEEG